MKNKRQLSVFENLIWNTVGSFTYLLCQWLLTLIVVRESGDMGNAGDLALAISITNIFFNVACFNVRPYLISDLKNHFSSREYSTFRILSCSGAIILCGIYVGVFHYSQRQMMCIMLYMIYKVGEAWVDLLHGFEQRRSRMDIGGISLFCRGILSVITFYLTLKTTQDINWSVALMAIVTLLFISIYDMPQAMCFEDLLPSFNRHNIILMLVEFLPLTVGAFLSSTGANLPRQVLEAQMGNESLGIYSTVATPAVIVQVAASYIFNPVLTEFAKYYNRNEIRKFTILVLKITMCIVVLAVSSVIGGKLLGRWGLELLYGNKIAKYVDLLIPVIIYTCLNAYVWFFWNLLIIMRKLKTLLLINGMGVILCIISMRKIISMYGMNGVSYVLIGYSIVLTCMMFVVLARDLVNKSRNKETKSSNL